MAITATISSHMHNNKPYIQSVKFNTLHNNVNSSDNNAINNLTDSLELLQIIKKHGSKKVYRVLVKKFMVKLQQEKSYNSIDMLIDEAIGETDKLYSRLNVIVPVI